MLCRESRSTTKDYAGRDRASPGAAVIGCLVRKQMSCEPYHTAIEHSASTSLLCGLRLRSPLSRLRRRRRSRRPLLVPLIELLLLLLLLLRTALLHRRCGPDQRMRLLRSRPYLLRLGWTERLGRLCIAILLRLDVPVFRLPVFRLCLTRANQAASVGVGSRSLEPETSSLKSWQ